MSKRIWTQSRQIKAKDSFQNSKAEQEVWKKFGRGSVEVREKFGRGSVKL